MGYGQAVKTDSEIVLSVLTSKKKTKKKEMHGMTRTLMAESKQKNKTKKKSYSILRVTELFELRFLF